MLIISGIAMGEVTVSANEEDRSIYNGKVLNGRTYAPIRAVGEKLDAQVGWSNKTKTATVKKDGKVLTIKLGSKVLKVNNESLQMDVSVHIDKGTIYLPVKYIGTALGYKTTWNHDDRIAYLEAGKPSISIYAQPLFYKDGYALLNEAIERANKAQNVSQKREYLKPYFTDIMISKIIQGKLTFLEESEFTSIEYSYPNDKTMVISSEYTDSDRFGAVTQRSVISKRNNQWVVSSIDEGFHQFMP